MDEYQQATLDRLIRIAQTDTGQGRKVADFLLSWWNTSTCGGFDLTDLWAVDVAIAQDMIRVIHLISQVGSTPLTRTLQISLIMGQEECHATEKKVQRRVQA